MSITPTEIAQMWRQVNRQMRELARSTVDRHDLPPLAIPVIHHVRKEPGITVSELARKIGAAKSHISTLTDGLVRDGYLDKQSDPADQRLIRIYLTQSARELLSAHEDQWQAMWAAVFEELPEKDLEDLGRFLRNLLGAFERANDLHKNENSPAEQIGVNSGE